MEIHKTHRWNDYIHSLSLLLRMLKLCRIMAPKEMLGVLAITALSGLSALAVLLSLQQLVDAIRDRESYQAAVWLTALILGMLLSEILEHIGNIVVNHLQELVKEKCQREIMEKATRLSLANFEQSSFYDRLQRVNEGMDQRFFSTMTFIFRILTYTITVVSILVYLLFIHWLIPIMLLVGTLLFTFIHVKVLKEKYLLHRKQTTPVRKLYNLEKMMTSRDAAAEVRLYGLKNHLLHEWSGSNDRLIGERLIIARREYCLQLTSSGGHTLMFAIVLFGTIALATKGALSVGQYASLIRAMLSFQVDLNNLMWNMAIVRNDLRYIEDFFDYLELPEENRNGVKLPAHQPLTQGIQLRGVSFAYPDTDQMVLKDLDLSIQAGEKIALIGDNGSGKSTLTKLLLGLYTPVAGVIQIDKNNLQNLNLDEWRAKATAIFQDFQKYELLNVHENIAVGQTEYWDDWQRVEQAALRSGAHEMVRSFVQGYETKLGKQFGGQELSQGQWQKIAVARAYLRDSELLILDEPTSALDAKAEVEIYRQFDQISEGKTVIFISHRLGVAKLADRIIVLKEGRIAEQGTHAELLSCNRHYAQMYQLQAQWYQ